MFRPLYAGLSHTTLRSDFRSAPLPVEFWPLCCRTQLAAGLLGPLHCMIVCWPLARVGIIYIVCRTTHVLCVISTAWLFNRMCFGIIPMRMLKA